MKAPIVDTSRSPHARLRPVGLGAVSLADEFWAPRRCTNRAVTLPSQHERNEETGRIDNFRRASRRKQVGFQGLFFNDSDVYKWMEAVAWELAERPDVGLAEVLEGVLGEVAAAQQPDGYLNSYFMFERAKERWTNLKDLHEMYCAGHLIQAAVAHHRATGSERFLTVATRLADHVASVFGPEKQGKRLGACGHEEIELALVELYRTTGERKYLDQARFFIDVRGRGVVGGSLYHQDHKPFRELEQMVGHAVRMGYLCIGATDLYAETGDAALLAALRRLWSAMVARQMYVSGGLGSRYEGEAFGREYELPNERAYTETCAAIAGVMWAWRMLQIDPRAEYADVMERMLFNAVMPGISLDGQHYFYQNPLADDGTHRRQGWFGCACCPPNIARLLSSLPGYFYSTGDEGLWVHLYAEGAARVELADGRVVQLAQKTRYPWDGAVELAIESEGEFALFLRIPGWCEHGSTVAVNGDRREVTGCQYARIARRWKKGDRVELALPMPVRRIECHPHALENRGQVALMRGPILYCLEGVDHPDVDLRDVVLPEGAALEAEHRPGLLGGVTVLRGAGCVQAPGSAWDSRLYRTRQGGGIVPSRPLQLLAVPYFAWANRDPGRMSVWLRSER